MCVEPRRCQRQCFEPAGATVSDDHPAASRPEAEVEGPRGGVPRDAHPPPPRRPVAQPEGNTAHDSGSDEACRGEHPRDDHRNDLEIARLAAAARARDGGVGRCGHHLHGLSLVTLGGGAGTAPQELNQRLGDHAVPKDLHRVCWGCGGAVAGLRWVASRLCLGLCRASAWQACVSRRCAASRSSSSSGAATCSTCRVG